MTIFIASRRAALLRPLVRLGQALAARADRGCRPDGQVASLEHPDLYHASDQQRGDRGAECHDPVDQVRRARLPEQRLIQRWPYSSTAAAST
jgi:hypothetical protein